MSAILVLDVSATLPWCFDDEGDAAGTALLSRVADSAILAPALWHTELANALLQAERRHRIISGDLTEFLDLLSSLAIETDHEGSRHALGPLLALARRHKLTVYDATYLDLALRSGLPLATRDRALRRAASACGVTLIDD